MKRKSLLLSFIALVSLGAGLIAVPSDDARVRALNTRVASSAVQTQILDLFPDPSAPKERVGNHNPMSRALFIYRVKSQYTMALVEHAPEGKEVSDTCIPFEVYDQPAYAKAAPPILLFGYFDGATKALQLYVAADLKYVAVTEHPLIKARLELNRAAGAAALPPRPRSLAN
jgi:hypothetical protein